jgi:predicted PurR-regulated permease PerM
VALLAVGFIGVFLGPTFIAVGFRLVEEWGSTNRAALGETEAINSAQQMKS